jgi:hypothetical protein
MEIGFSVMVFALRIGRNRHGSFVFLLPCRPRDSLGLFLGSDVFHGIAPVDVELGKEALPALSR